MPRTRVRAAARKAEHREAHLIGSGVYSIARDLHGGVLALPVYVTAPLVYVSEMIAAVICRDRGWDRERADQVARYLMASFQEVAVALFERFDVKHFEEWIAAADRQEARGG